MQIKRSTAKCLVVRVGQRLGWSLRASPMPICAMRVVDQPVVLCQSSRTGLGKFTACTTGHRCFKFYSVRTLIHTTTALLLALTLGLHWALLQTVAWTGMAISYSRDASLVEALKKTFDGEHPCCLCKAIASGKKSEKKSEAVSPLLKMEFPLVAGDLRLFPPARFAELRRMNFFADSLFPKPPVPPPRSFPA